MCGRFSQTFTPGNIREYFKVTNSIDLVPRYNIAPSQEVIAIREIEGKRTASLLLWGLIPFWAKDRKIGFHTLNARPETVDKAPAFRSAFQSRRCLIPASGFYEWEKKDGTKQPYYIRRTDGAPLALAGLWEHWEDQEQGKTVESCTILTTDSSEPVAKIHSRMPVLLELEDFGLWLNPGEHGVERVRKLMTSAAPGTLAMYPVSTYVNKVANEGKRCIDPIES